MALVLISLLFLNKTEAQSALWVQTVNPSSSADVASALAQDNEGLFVLGTDRTTGTGGQWRIEKRNFSDGSPIASFGTGGVIASNPHATRLDEAKDLVVYSSALYAVGNDRTLGSSNSQWRIEKRDLGDGSLIGDFGTGGILTENISSYYDGITVIVADPSGMILAGYDNALGSSSYQWRIEKRDWSTGALIANFGINGVITVPLGSQTSEPALSLALDGTNFYIAGTDKSISTSDTQWHIEKRKLDDGSLVSSFGENGIIIENVSAYDDEINSIVYDNGYIFIAGYDKSLSSTNARWRVEKRETTNGALDETFGSNGTLGINPGNYNDGVTALTVKSNNFFIAGYDRLNASYTRWRIEKRSIISGNPALPFGSAGAIIVDPSNYSDTPYDVLADENGIYIGGCDRSQGSSNDQWRIEKYSQMGDFYTVSASAGEHGSISPNGEISVGANMEQQFSITPDPGYVVDTVNIDGTDFVLSEYTFANITANHTIDVTFAPIIDNSGRDYRKHVIAASWEKSLVTTSDGKLWAAGSDVDYNEISSFNEAIGDVAEVAHQDMSTLVLKKDGSLWVYGANWEGQLGTGDDIDVSEYTDTGIRDVIAVAVGECFSLIVKKDGTLWAAGTNYGQLGLGDEEYNYFNYTQVPGIDNVVDVAAGGYHTVILTEDGTVLTTGENGSGQLGLGDTTDRIAFTSVGITDGEVIGAGWRSSYVIKADGTLWATGFNNYGQLGLETGDTDNRSYFTQTTLANIVSVSGGVEYTMALSADGTASVVGNNEYGALGVGGVWRISKLDPGNDQRGRNCG